MWEDSWSAGPRTWCPSILGGRVVPGPARGQLVLGPRVRGDISTGGHPVLWQRVYYLSCLCPNNTMDSCIDCRWYVITYWSRSRTHVLRSDSRFLEGFLWRIHASSESLPQELRPCQKSFKLTLSVTCSWNPAPPTSSWFPNLHRSWFICHLQFKPPENEALL